MIFPDHGGRRRNGRDAYADDGGKHLSEYVTFAGFKKPEQVREYMENADIFLFTSDYGEGWGAVLNEAMNSCMAVVADCGIGAAPFLLKPGKNGMVYPDGNFAIFIKTLQP